jgi:DnaJ-class molecular chaperone
MFTTTTTTTTDAHSVLARLGFRVLDVFTEGGEASVTVECRECTGSGYVPTVDSFQVCSECFGLGDITDSVESIVSAALA